MPTHKHTLSVTTPEGAVTKKVSVTGDANEGLDVTIAGLATDTLVNVAFTQAGLKSIYIVTDQDLSLETNATNHASGDIIALSANKPLQWYTGGPVPLTTWFNFDVTKFYFTNAGATAANVTIRILRDSTP